MNTSRMEFPLMILVFPAFLGALSSCYEPRDSGSSCDPAQEMKGVSGTSLAEIPPLSEVQVKIEDFKFEPERVSIRPGTKVTWVNKDDEPHSATSSEKPKRFDSGALDSAESFSFTFTEPGSFSYFCKLHPHMTGVVVVQ